MPTEDDEMEPAQIAVETLGGDAAEAPQEALDLAVAAGGLLDVHGPPPTSPAERLTLW